MVARQLLQLKISHPPVTTFKSQKKRRGKQELLPVQPLLFFFKSEVKLFFLCPLLLLLLSLFSHVRLCGPPWTAASQASIYRILQARMLEWVAMPCSRGIFPIRDPTQASCTAGGFFTTEPLGSPLCPPSAVQSGRSVVSDSVRPHGLQHARPPCPSPTPRVYPNSCPLSQ